MNRAAACADVRTEALVVLDVAGRQLFWRSVVKLSEQVFGQFAHGVDQHIQAAAVGHANHNFLHAFFTRSLNELVNGCNEGFATLQRETFLTHIFGVQETL